MIIACDMVVFMVNATFNSATSRETSHCFLRLIRMDDFKLVNTSGRER